jgi:hypothetical protein
MFGSKELQWLQNQGQINGYNLKNIRHEISAWKIKNICELFEQALSDTKSQDS